VSDSADVTAKPDLTAKIDPDASSRMDEMYRYQRFIYDLTRKYYLIGRDTLLERLDPPTGGTILEIGCGTGRNLLKTARLYPEHRIFGFDISSAMLRTARRAVLRAQLGERIALAEADATTFDAKAMFGRAAARGFDRIYISYTLSMVPDWRDVLPKAIAALAPGGALHIVDFGQQSGLPSSFRHLLFAWLARFSVHPARDLSSTIEGLAKGAGLSLHLSHPYRGYAIYAVLKQPA
jgi:S-adenosylmethionine-diacylgycerolhomoserine-N-methlytransferase